MAGKRKRRVSKRKLFYIVACVFALYKATAAGLTILQLQHDIKESSFRLQEVQDRNTLLLEKKAMLQDPQYIALYSKGKLQLSAEGEQIFVITESK